MILLDTHIWVWWMNGEGLSQAHREAIASHETTGIAISVMSCWEVAKLVELGRLRLGLGPWEWVQRAITHPSLSVLPLTPFIAVQSTLLPDWSHRDPMDRFIVATAQAHDCVLATADERIRNYQHVRTI